VGRYIDRNAITVSSYLDQWIEAHAVEIKPKTQQDYRHLIAGTSSRTSALCACKVFGLLR